MDAFAHPGLERTTMKQGLLPLLLCLCPVVSGLRGADGAVFRASLDGQVRAATAGGEVVPRVEGAVRTIEGVRGQAAVVGGANRVLYPAEGVLPTARGTCALWVCPLDWTPAVQHFTFFVTFTHRGDAPLRQAVRVILYKVFNEPTLRLLFQNDLIKRTNSIGVDIALWQPGQWHHLAFTWDDARIRLYVDGAEAASMPPIGLPDSGWQDIILGIGYPGWGSHPGHVLGPEATAIDEVRLEARVLSADEIREAYREVATTAAVAVATVAAVAALDGGAAREGRGQAVEMPENLARQENGAFIVTSSFANDSTLYEDNLIDGRDDTSWQPMEDEYPQTLELRWEFPVIADAASFTGTGVRAASVHAWDRAAGLWRALKAFSPAEVAAGLASFPSVKTDRLRIVIDAGEKVALSAVGVYGPDQPLIGRSRPYWDAWYIWYPESDKVHKGNQPRYFRKTFELEDMGLVSAHLQSRSNDYYRIWINGQEAATGSTVITPVPVGHLLREGTNVIAAEADLGRNPGRWGWGEFLTELSISYAGVTRRIGTGPGWRSCDRKADGWQAAAFDDTGWQEAFLYARPPEGPWGRIAYHDTSVRESASVDRVAVVPPRPSPGTTARVEVALKAPAAPLKRDYVFVLELGEEGVDPTLHGSYVVVRDVVDSDAVRRAPDGTLTIASDLPIPPHTPSGSVPLRLKAYDRQTGAELDLAGTARGEILRLDIPARAERTRATGQAHIAYTNGQASFVVDGQVTTPLFRRQILLSDPERLYNGREHSGIGIYYTIQQKANLLAPEADFDTIDQRIRSELSTSPDSRIIVAFSLCAGSDWLQAHPAERLINAFGKPDVVSYASAAYLAACLTYLDKALDFLRSRPYWDKIIGFQPHTHGISDSVMGGTVGNTWQADRGKITAGDFNPQAIERFREFLRATYDNDVQRLRAAWQKPEVTFETARPDIRELVAEGKDGGIFRDPSEGMMTFDYAEFLPTMLGNVNRRMARFIKDETDWQKMVFIHYGYLIEHMRGLNNPGSQLNNNNYDLTELLRDPAIDGYIGAPNYDYRRAGTPMVNYFAWSTYRLHGRMYLPDDDHRYHVAGTKLYGRLRSRRETRAIIRRNVGAYITRNFGAWFADMSRGDGRSGVSWTGEPEVADLIGEMNRVYRQAIETGYASAAEVAVIFSAESNRFLDVYYGPTLMNNLIQWMYYPEFFRLGAPFDVYLAEDLTHPELRQDYKLYVMMNVFHLTEAQRAAVEGLKRDGHTILWFYAPDYVGRDGLSAARIAAITGMAVEALDGREQMAAAVVPSGHPLSAGLDDDDTLAARGFTVPATVRLHPTEFGPRFRITDADAAVIARFADGQGALAARDFGDWKSVYSVVPRLEAPLLRNILRWAGVHVYTEAPVTLDANRHVIVVHNGYDAARDVPLALPRKTDVVDALTGAPLASGTAALTLRLEKADTRVLFLK